MKGVELFFPCISDGQQRNRTDVGFNSLYADARYRAVDNGSEEKLPAKFRLQKKSYCNDGSRWYELLFLLFIPMHFIGAACSSLSYGLSSMGINQL